MDERKLLYVLDGEPIGGERTRCLEMFGRLGFTEAIVLGGKEDLERKWPDSVDGMRLRTEFVRESGNRFAKAALERAARESVSIVVVAMAMDNQARFARSVTRKLLLSSMTPVLAVPLSGDPPIPDKRSIFSHIVFATNWSKACERAFQYLLMFKSVINALEVVNVVNSKLSVREMRGVKQQLTETRTKFVNRGVDAEFHVYAGKRFREIALAARDYRASCIVMGGNGKGRFARVIAKDRASRVFRHAQLPVLVIP